MMEKKGQRLSKYLKNAGVASRRECEKIIFEGKVTVNGAVVLVPQKQVIESDEVKVEGKHISKIEEKVYYLLNKPAGYLCAAKSHRGEKLVLDLFKREKKRLFTVGRLDKDTTGLLIVTNDGEFANRVIHPSFDREREYLVEVTQPIFPSHIQALYKGDEIEGKRIKPVKVKKKGKNILFITVKEGKKREVRHLIAKAGFKKIVRLVRFRLGKLVLKNLLEGQWRLMTQKERAFFD